jgi:aspartyl-tRNA(Asn)/glutamyl-tRNA(Gln) amidotransferase subunit C
VKIDRKAVLHLANLANLTVSEDEISDLQQKLSGIVDYISSLNELSADNIADHESLIIETRERDDVVEPSLLPEEALSQAPAKAGTAFQVPRIIDAAE